RAQWQPREEVTLPISTDNVVLVVRGSHTYLFWLTRDDAGSPSSDESPKDFNYDRITLAWSERRRDGRSDPRMADSVVISRLSAVNSDGPIPANKYLLKTINTSPLVEVRAYVVNGPVTMNLDFQRFLFNPSTKRARSAPGGTTYNAQSELSVL